MTQKHHIKQHAQLRRPHFSPRQLLTSDQLNQAQAFQIANLQRALHALAGSGVVYGFNIGYHPEEPGDYQQTQPEKGSIYLECGLAFDHHGRQLNWPGGWLSVRDLVGEPPEEAGEYTLSAHYAERHMMRPKNVEEGCGCDSDEDSILWIETAVVFTLKKGCHKKEHVCFHEQEKCLDLDDYVCEWITQKPCYKAPDGLCPTQCEGEYYDPHQGIPLACVNICQLSKDPEQCSPQYGFDDKPIICCYRPFVYPNNLLYELIRGDQQNYARVECLSWQDWILYNRDWGELVPWENFKQRVNDENGFVITFSKPIQTRTLHPGSIILSAVAQEARTDYWESRRIPLKVISLDPFVKEGCEYANSIKLCLEDNWRQSEIEDQRSTLEDGVIIELKIPGSLLRDECGCMLDARPLGYEKPGQHCCQSLPGGDFIALFRVAPKEQRPAPGYSTTPVQYAE